MTVAASALLHQSLSCYEASGSIRYYLIRAHHLKTVLRFQIISRVPWRVLSPSFAACAHHEGMDPTASH